ncbi:MAG: hypothetical protein V4591_05510 [Bdellovibrionota bacterium]
MIKKIFYVVVLAVGFLLVDKSYAANNLSLSIKATDTNGNSVAASSPAVLLDYANNSSNTPIASIEVILTGTISTYTFTEPGTYTPGNWGIVFAPASGSSITCDALSACDGATITVSSTGLPTTSSVGTAYTISNASAAFDITITFSNPTTTLPQDFITMLSSTPISVSYIYIPTGSTSGTPGPDKGTWQSDKGTLVNAPTLQGNNKSILAQNMAFEITNINQPSSLTAVCPSADGSTCTTTNDGVGATTLITSTTGSNSVSGYVVGFWKDSDCKIGGFKFAPNWMAYEDPLVASNYTCSYTAWQSSFGTGGTSSDLGCASATSQTFLSGAAAPDANSAAIPYLGGINGKVDLQTIMNTSGESSYSGSCISYVYLSTSGSSSSSYVKGPINNGDVYGVVVWALNSASDPVYDIPNYSLAHSNVFYTTGINFELASTAKDSSLALTKDCFVVTAASGNIHSPSVVYWRAIRDAYLNQIGFTKFYYKHAKTWAHWLDEHPKLKPPLNFIFEKSGYTLYHTGNFVTEAAHKTKNIFHKVVHFVSNLLDNSAQAQELAFEQVPNGTTNQNNKSGFGFEQSEQQNIDVIPEDMNTDPFFKMPKKGLVLPMYDFDLKVGVLMPTQDVDLYDTYYSSQPTLFGEVGLSRIFWPNNFGVSIGLLGRYMTNTQKADATVLGSSTESYDRKFYALTSEVLVGVRYRNPNFLYIQPGIFFGGGVTRFREEAIPEGGSSGSSYGVTEFSPIYQGGVNIDISLSSIAGQPPSVDKDDLLNEVLLRLSASYNLNDSEALSSTGYFVSAGFAFLLN